MVIPLLAFDMCSLVSMLVGLGRRYRAGLKFVLFCFVLREAGGGAEGQIWYLF